MQEKVLIIGLGEIGHALFQVFKESGKFDVYGFDLEKEKMRSIVGQIGLPKRVDVMHVCYPFSDQGKFLKITLDYIKNVKPKLTIIESTVPPGTTKEIYRLSGSPTANSPIRGMHETLETMKRDILFWRKYIGGATQEAADSARRHFEKLGLKVKVLNSSLETELAKLFETIYRAWMIACFQEMHRISRYFKADFNEVVDMLEDIHRIDRNKPLHYPGVIGGHCLIPNTELLLKSYSSEFLRLILKSNEKRKQEMKSKIVQLEVEKVKERVKKLDADLTKRKD